VGMETVDMEYISYETEHVTGVPESLGGSGNPSPVTAYGVYCGMKGAAHYTWGTDDLSGKKVMVQGVGHVGETLVDYLTKEGAKVFINDIGEERVADMAKKYGATPVPSDQVYSIDVDIYAPCALGATLNDDTIAQLKCKVVAGAANNQLEQEAKHGQMLVDRGIVYAPDFLINAGGLINVYSELSGYGKEEAMFRTSNIRNTTLEILKKAEKENITPQAAALKAAQERIDAMEKVHSRL
ncbi:MAG: leucine dehydrogenase, partial [Bacteroidia bacterium]